MKEKWLVTASLFILLLLLLSSSSWAGQVVTQDVRLWAQKVLAEEKGLRVVEARNTTAVLYFQNRTEMPGLNPLQKGITLMLVTDLSNVKGLQVVERVRLQALLEEMDLGASGLVQPDTAPRVGKLLGARWIVGGDILPQEPEELRLRSSALDVPTQKIIGQPTTGGKLADLLRMEKDLLFGIIKVLKIEVPPAEAKELRKPCSTNSNALLQLFRGIDASDQGDYEKAAKFYQNALEEDPNICTAKEALDELRALGLIAKRSREMLRSLRDQTSLTDQLTTEEVTKRERTPKDIPTSTTTSTKVNVRFP